MPAVMKPKGLRGIHCPACYSKDVTPDGWTYPTAGLCVRYFQCHNPKCKGRFRVKARVDGMLKPRKN